MLTMQPRFNTKMLQLSSIGDNCSQLSSWSLVHTQYLPQAIIYMTNDNRKGFKRGFQLGFTFNDYKYFGELPASEDK